MKLWLHPGSTRFLLLALFLTLTWPSLALSRTVVRMETVLGDIDIELYDEIAPNTVANFLNYVRNGDYSNSFIHRSVPGFVIQGGGFAWDDALEDQFPIPTDPPIVNEFNLSNVRGTIAMAKVPGTPDSEGNCTDSNGVKFPCGPNSATSQWFFNLADNSGILDPQNGGFTVFGKVIGNGMAVVDSIAKLDIYNAGSPFNELPLLDTYPGTGSVLKEHLVIVEKTYEIPRLVIDRSILDYGSIFTGNNATLSITITNGSSVALDIGAIAGIDVLSPPFNILIDTCSNQSIAIAGSCVLEVQFSPLAADTYTDSFDIPSNDPATPTAIVQLSGKGVDAPEPNIVVSPLEPLDLEGVVVGDSGNAIITVTNFGSAAADLSINSVGISGASASEFSQTNNCVGAVVTADNSCAITVSFNPTTAEDKSAVLTIDSNDPDQPSVSISLQGTGLKASAPLISVSTDSLEFRNVIIANPASQELIISNNGTLDLTINAITISGLDASDFSVNSCTIIEARGGTCNLTVTFNPETSGAKNALLTLDSNDPDNPTLLITLTGISSNDTDGVSDAIEDAGPNGGDGNNDGIPDRKQSNVTTFVSFSGEYVTLVSEEGTFLSNVRSTDNPSPNDMPVGYGTTVTYDQGFFSFTLEGIEPGGATTITILLPPGRTATHYFKYSPNPDTVYSYFAFPAWYLFMYDGKTGAEIIDNKIILHFIDGDRGDADVSANGKITDPGGPATIASISDKIDVQGADNGGGCSLAPPRVHRQAGGWWLILVFLAWLGMARSRAASIRSRQ